ncbi:ribonuclease III [Corynebacterium epidermidicanis]|uniref:Ribonuclease 3 n=1 Tax=Corynebacterium epidermidicanis TaxID=1050174 RepID=A0A0G3GX58_9CORY|nr:ribonuclease III [Corynebacterium epidermidicanis]AKK03452.1 RNAse III [Corynebacterium epidermidicanis]
MSRKKHRETGLPALEKAFAAVDHAPLLTALGVQLSDDSLRLALTHRSFANENGNLPNNERLEFLGDAVLGLSVANQLYVQYPTRPESDISKMRAGIVSRYGLADIAREIGLGEHILLGKGEALSDGRTKDSILADTTEALLGAIYLEHGFEIAREVVLRLFQRKIDTASSKAMNQDWKTMLQERVAERKLAMPEYSAEVSGPDHDTTFVATVTIEGVELGQGSGQNKKLAEQHAAHVAYLALLDLTVAEFESKRAQAAQAAELG